MSVDLSQARRWRMRADEVRARADLAHSPEVARRLRSIADTYDELARNEERIETVRQQIREAQFILGRLKPDRKPDDGT